VEEEGGGVGFHKNLDAPPSFSAWPCAGSAGEAGGDRETRGVWPALRVWGQGSCRARRGGGFLPADSRSSLRDFFYFDFFNHYSRNRNKLGEFFFKSGSF
jgi:hypothetical protein